MRRPERVRFAVVGDVGRDDAAQRSVARGIHAACGGDCDFTLLLGDNLYWEGIRPDHRQHDEALLGCLVARYPGPKFPVLGNHDYHPILPDLERAGAQLAWFARPGDDVHGAAHFYRVDAGLVTLFAIDTNLLVRGRRDVGTDPRLVRFGRQIGHRPRDGWTVVFGHHPVLSNGQHGDAGAFVERDRFALWSGAPWRTYFATHVAGHADLYLAGHDHDLQFFGRSLGTDTALAVVGSGSSATARSASPRHADAWMERYGFGFATVEATVERLSVTFHDAFGEAFWSATRDRRGPWRADRSIDPVYRGDRERRGLEEADAAAGGQPCP